MTVTVTNPGAGSGTSNAMTFTVATPAPVAVLQIDAGGKAVAPFAADQDYAGGGHHQQ